MLQMMFFFSEKEKEALSSWAKLDQRFFLNHEKDPKLEDNSHLLFFCVDKFHCNEPMFWSPIARKSTGVRKEEQKVIPLIQFLGGWKW